MHGFVRDLAEQSWALKEKKNCCECNAERNQNTQEVKNLCDLCIYAFMVIFLGLKEFKETGHL